jgi:hypothetical protein
MVAMKQPVWPTHLFGLNSLRYMFTKTNGPSGVHIQHVTMNERWEKCNTLAQVLHL